MLVFGWIALILVALFGMFCIGLIIGPSVLSKIKTFTYRLKKLEQDEKDDADKRSDERKRRDEIKRQKDFELANKKLDAKLNKVDKQIKLQTKKLKLAEKMKEETQLALEDLQTNSHYYEQETDESTEEIENEDI